MVRYSIVLKPEKQRNALVLIELLVILGVVSIITLLTIIAVNQSRDSARRLACSANLQQIGISLNQYSTQHSSFPAGMPSIGYSWLVSILPALEYSDLYNHVNFSQRGASFLNTLQRIQINSFICPSDSISHHPLKQTNYAANFGRGVQKFGLDGLFHYDKPVNIASISDGLSNTAAVSEWLVSTGYEPFKEPASRVIFDTAKKYNGAEQFDMFYNDCMLLNVRSARRNLLVVGIPWTHGHLVHSLYNHTGRPFESKCTNGNVVQEGSYTVNSNHQSGVNLLFADGHIQFVKKSINLATWRAIGSKAGSETVDLLY